MEAKEIKRAIISLSDKTGSMEFAQYLDKKGIEIYSTGGTFKLLKDNGINVKEVTELTGFPEMMDGRIKTLNPKVHGGILAVRDNEDHIKQALENGVEMIDLLVVNLYPFEQAILKQGVSLEEAIENIDIGGPAMLRSGAKNYRFVTVITEPSDYKRFIDEYESSGGTSLKFREELALKVFAKTSKYDAMISEYLEKALNDNFKKTIILQNGKVLRYGENSHQKGILFSDDKVTEGTLANAIMINGKEMSYNNYMDAQAALDTVLEFDEPAAVVIKHTNPCGAATAENIRKAVEIAWFSDPISAMGSVVAFNREFDMDALRFFRGDEIKHLSFTVENDKLVSSEIKRKFIEVIIAPSYSEEALKYISTKKNFENVRVLQISLEVSRKTKDFNLKRIDGGYLYQTTDNELCSKLDTVTKAKFSEDMLKLAEFSYKCCKHTKSNAIVLCRKTDNGFQVLGMGAGQPNRVDSLRKLAVTKAKENLEYEYRSMNLDITFEDYFKKVISEQTVLASDAFFPFDDTVKTAAGYGIKYIIQPGGSQNDQDSIDACDELGIAMIFAGNRHFRH
ncbi:MAG: bifunctional phosphoribosylaminoimidazolecarboxamide formyltransferase/IMP cyclohydrolase [Candidatus Delongbacteria bacterium]|nr:bifunctional phosphoribosylaminoimidazolecarboxamide formyltransferase/IMP cyclohydrolase [Candidatus Delongbacteria bacterium]MCG2760893.1 bifunctional phosphoribosylaminoimidazolecarboxamide formyltransferase/IMP cyclohydrolase [Candidatus Delongbacteria bacterium]